MHSFKGKNGTDFFYNGDFSEIQLNNYKISDGLVEINAEDFMEFARMSTVTEIIKMLECKYM